MNNGKFYNIKALRVRAKLTQEETASLLDMSKTNYNLKENNRGAFTLEQLEQLRNLLESRIGEKITLDEMTKRG